MLISVHLPKTAGTSFGASLKEHFGDSLLLDYKGYAHRPDYPPANGTQKYYKGRIAMEEALGLVHNEFTGIQCIHGHFLPLRYLLLSIFKPIKFITWMRHPVDRVISHYYYWKRTYNGVDGPPLHHQMMNENWSLEKFCLEPRMHNFYSDFLWGFPLYNFSFIGITECYESELSYFETTFLNTITQPQKENIGENGGKGYNIDNSLRDEIEKCNAKDMQLYKEALKLRESRIEKLSKMI